jgi:selenocysteine-specific elongation factor
MHIVGTAGHVDHGKSSLVHALTGTNPDRWLEERRRGMTLDLGFAHLRFDDGNEAAIVDVPGHERFLHNMLAGAAGMDIVLLVVAANEGPKPQTLEHLAILRYLKVRRTLVVLSKADTVDAEELAFAAELTREALEGTIAEGAPLYPVSTFTREGIEALRAAIGTALHELPAQVAGAPAYLPLDRAFTLAGHGTIVTGTLMQGRIAVGDVLKLSPLDRNVRVRSLQVFGKPRDAATGGSRVALNLPGIELSEVARGAVLATPQSAAAATFDVRFVPLESALPIVKRRTPVRAYIGSAEILGTLVCEATPTSAATCSARLHLRAPTVAFPGTPFVVRRLSPKTLLGGGLVIAGDVPGGDDATEDNDERASVLAVLQGAGLAGAQAAAVGAAANLGEERARELLASLVDDGFAVPLTKPAAFVHAARANEFLIRVRTHLQRAQAERPWLTGAPASEVARALQVEVPLLVRVLAAHVADGSLVYRSGSYATTDFVPELSAAQKSFFDAAFAPGGIPTDAPLAFSELVASMKASAVAGVSAAFNTLVATGILIRVGDFIYRGAQIAAILTELERALAGDGRLTVSEFRTLTGTTRKHAVPLLEFFDATGVTLRSGDVRTLRGVRRAVEPSS